MDRYRDKKNISQVTSFQFENLNSDHVIVQENVKPFEFKSLGDLKSVDAEAINLKDIRAERSYEKKSSFKIEDVVRVHRGYIKQEENDFEERVSREVERRLQEIKDRAYEEGLAIGKKKGEEAINQQVEEEFQSKIDFIHQLIEDVTTQVNRYLESNKSEMYEFIKKFTKWIILKEINPPDYLESLLEKLVLEMNSRRNLIIKVGKENFSLMPSIIQMIEKKLGELPNVRVEMVPEIHYPGIILESENGLIDGSMEFIFQNIDKIFEQVISHEQTDE